MTDLICPKCAYVSQLGDACPTCDLPLIPMNTLPPWGLARTVDQRIDHVSGWQFGLRIVGVVAMALLTVYGLGGVFGALGLSVHTALFRLASDLVLSLGLLGVGVAMFRRSRRRAESLPSRVLAHERYDQTPQTSVRESADGAVVKLRGRVTVRSATATEQGERCAAFQELLVVTDRRDRTPDPQFASQTAGGGIFELQEPSGEVATVVAQHVHVLDDQVIRDGDEVEVVGLACRTASTREDIHANFRTMPTDLVVHGTSDQPLVLRRVTAAEGAEPAVRVRVDAAGEGAAGEKGDRASDDEVRVEGEGDAHQGGAGR